jgi:heme exporter protein B
MKHPIIALLKKDLIAEWRMRYALNGVLLHVISSVFLVFLSVKIMNAPTWNAFFWLILLFSSISAVAKGFIGENKGRSLYYFSISSPQHIIIAKIIFNNVFMLFIACLCFGVYTLLLGNLAQSQAFYLLVLILGCIGFSTTFTLLSAIAAKSGNGHLLMPVLSFPIIIPLLLVLVKASKKAMDGIDSSLLLPDLGVIVAINFIVLALSFVLFPYLWKD